MLGSFPNSLLDFLGVKLGADLGLLFLVNRFGFFEDAEEVFGLEVRLEMHKPMGAGRNTHCLHHLPSFAYYGDGFHNSVFQSSTCMSPSEVSRRKASSRSIFAEEDLRSCGVMRDGL